jgi:serine/threonine protein kinase
MRVRSPILLARFCFCPFRILKSIDNENAIVTFDVFEDNDQIELVSEYMKGGELFDRHVQETVFTEDKARAVMRQILLGVAHFHSKGIVHRDIKPENALCLETQWPFTVKPTDFGLSNFLDEVSVDSNIALHSLSVSSEYA